jgi:hypothetical protein
LAGTRKTRKIPTDFETSWGPAIMLPGPAGCVATDRR